MMKINPAIFKAYDIRGKYPAEVNEEVAEQLGRAFAERARASKIIIGRDMRLSSDCLREALIKGATEQGAGVADIGLVSVDMFYHACGSQDLPGIMITASHNPKEDNGFKMVRKMPDLVSGEEMREEVTSGNFKPSGKTGSVAKLDLKESYRWKILSLADTGNLPRLKVAVDPANGMGGPAFDLVYKDLPIEVTRLCFEPDGNFPNHGGDPYLAENTRDLEKRVLKEKADLGFAFDSDADRFFAIDNLGQKVPADFLLALFGRYLIEKHGGGTIVYDNRSSWAVKDLATAAGGLAVETRVGHRFIKTKMWETKAIFGGEATGHFLFPDFYSAESAAGASLLLLEMLGFYKKSLAELAAPLRARYFNSGEINSQVTDTDAILAKIEEKYKNGHKLYHIDGINIVGENWWASVRKSNTQPLLRLNVEALVPCLMEGKRDELLKIIKAS